MSWTKKTSQFGDEELGYLESLPVDQLAGLLLNSSPVVVLRALAEIMLNEDIKRLNALLARDDISALWQNFRGDTGLDSRDYDYAEQLHARLKKV